MTLHKLTAGDGYTYLTRQVAAHDVTERGYDSLGDYYAEKGESPGVWMGSGCYALPQFLGGEVREDQMRALFGEGRHPDVERIEDEMRASGHAPPAILAATRLGTPFVRHDDDNEFRRRAVEAFAAHNLALGFPRGRPLPADERAEIRTAVAREMFAEEYGRIAVDAREVSGFLARISRQATTAVAGYDLTFSPVKSVSVLWALAPREVAEVIEQAHADAVRDVLGWLERAATYARTGHAGVRQIEVNGLIAAAFTHRDSRAGDPNLHTHVAISNKVQTRTDGRWLALDGRPLHKAAVAASERYNTRIEALLRQRLGLRFAEGPARDPAKRPVREIVGMDTRILARWSQRRAQIDSRRADLAADFQTAHGRPPTTIEAIGLAQQANLETRQGKHEARSPAEQRAVWRAEAVDATGHSAVHAMLTSVLNRRVISREPRRVPDVAAAADRVLATVQAWRATWQECHVRAETERFLRAHDIYPERLDETVEAIVAAELAPGRSIALGGPEPVNEPFALRRSDGTSVYETAGTQLYTSAQILAAEQRLVDHARARGGRIVTGSSVEIALVESAANGVELNPGQAQLVRELAASGARLQLALAPAGTGKTSAMRALASAWRTPDATGRSGHVVGLAPSAAAAAVLRDEVGIHTDTLAKLIHTVDNLDRPCPAWVAAIGPDTLVIVDEAGMASTSDLARTVDFVASRGGTVRLAGDDQQLAAVGAGGVLRDIASQVGAVHLSQVMRFADTAEAAVSLALRAGDSAAVGYYLDNRRVHVGDRTTVTDDAYRAWAADRAAGRDSIMIAPTRELVAALNARARTDRLAADPRPAVQETVLGDGSRCGVGDVIITRRNDRRLPITGTDFVKNGDRWTVLAVAGNGSLTVRHHGTGRRVVLPSPYVVAHVGLGYAVTVHGAQGVTADTSHLVATGAETRQLLYVAMTRGRAGNHIYLSTAGDGDPHSVITRDALLPPTAADVMARIMARDGSQASATTTRRELDSSAIRLHAAVARYQDALLVAADAHLGPAAIAHLEAIAEDVVPGVTAADAWPALRSHLALHLLDGGDQAAALRDAVGRGTLMGSRDVAAVLDWRLDTAGPSRDDGPLPWLRAVPQRLANDPTWGTYFRRRAALVAEHAAAVRDEAAEWKPATAPPWASGLIETSRELVSDLAVWRAATGIDGTDRDPAGPRPESAAEARWHQHLRDRLHAAVGHGDAATAHCVPFIRAIEERVASDAYWPELAERLDAARRAGIDVADIVKSVAASGPLPDEYPAAALWWRISRHMSPAAASANSTTGTTLHPTWVNDLNAVLADRAVHSIVEDPAWPALVAAVTAADKTGWAPLGVIAAAYELLDSGQPAGEPIRDHELATALTWRIGILTKPCHGEPAGAAEPPRPAADLTSGSIPALAPDGTHQFANSVAPQDGEWLHSLDRAEPVDPADLTVWDPSDDATPPTAARVAWIVADPDRGVNADALYCYPSRTGVPRERLLELNEQAHDFYVRQFDHSWAPAYLADRLGRDLAEQARNRYASGYAPARWTALADHLRRLGADDGELLAAGLAVRASTGRLIDRFRDRLIMPIWHADELHGFIGRRNPIAADDGRAGPKYLNTAETDLFHKGAQLYGLHEGSDLLEAGAVPALVEGPFDAWAITLAGAGRFVGVAPLGTAFTDEQADQLWPYIHEAKPSVIVATDNDDAGRKAAERAYWQLTTRQCSPRHLDLPDGTDPADLLSAHGPQALRTALEEAPDLAGALIDHAIDRFAERLETVECRLAACRIAARIVAALPPDEWLAQIERVQERLDLTAGSVQVQVLEANEVEHQRRLDRDDADARPLWAKSAAKQRRPSDATGECVNSSRTRTLQRATLAGGTPEPPLQISRKPGP